jgi:hypothetical protein
LLVAPRANAIFCAQTITPVASDREAILRNPGRFRAAALAALLLALAFAHPALAQQRLSDKEIEKIMKTLSADAKRFESSFNKAISKSDVRKLPQEKTDRELVKSFQAQTEKMLQVFQANKKADTTLMGVLNTARQIDDIFVDIPMTGAVRSDWNKCKTDLATLTGQFNKPAS